MGSNTGQYSLSLISASAFVIQMPDFVYEVLTYLPIGEKYTSSIDSWSMSQKSREYSNVRKSHPKSR